MSHTIADILQHMAQPYIAQPYAAIKHICDGRAIVANNAATYCSKNMARLDAP